MEWTKADADHQRPRTPMMGSRDDGQGVAASGDRAKCLRRHPGQNNPRRSRQNYKLGAPWIDLGAAVR